MLNYWKPLLCLIILTCSCKHDPFSAPPGTMGNGPGTNPNDSLQGKPCHPDTIYYNRDIQPLLNTNCAYSGCHDAATATDGVDLSDYNAVMNTADVNPFDANGSDLYEVLIETDPDKRMPFNQPPLPAAQIERIRQWIVQGALNLSCTSCDTTGLTYSNAIKAIFDQNCTSCHGTTNPSAGLSLSSYTNVQDALLNTDLIARINNDPGVPVMPQGGKMPDCTVRKIEIWFADGMPQ